MNRCAFLVLLAILLLAICTAPACADTRIALIIGNGAYQHAPRLPNPTNDAQDVAVSLKRSGFETIVGLDLDRTGMEEATIKFSRAARTADVAVFYYSGHAMQFAGINYLIPVDAKLMDEADLRRMIEVDEVVADLQQAKTLRILVLDSCRNNPLAELMKRSIGASRALPIQDGLAKIASPEGMIISYATQAGRTAEDGHGRNSPFTAAFLRHIEENEEIGTIFRQITSDVYETTKRTQLPELSLSFVGEFYLRGRVDVTVSPAPATPDPCAAASEHWHSTEAIGTSAAYEDHLKRFPNCAFAGLANVRLEALKNGQAAVVPPAAPIVPSGTVTLQTGLVGHWPLDGDTTNWATNIAQDTSGNGNDAMMVQMSAATSLVPGKIGGAFKFNGKNRVQGSTNLTAISSGTAYSIAYWQKTASTNAGPTTLVAYSHSNSLQFIGMGYGAAHKPVFFNKDDTGNTEALVGSADVADGNWHYIVGTRNGSLYKIYVDGSEAGRANNPTLGTITPNCFSIGFNCHLGGMFFYNGTLDDVRIYNRALSAQEVTQLYSMSR